MHGTYTPATPDTTHHFYVKLGSSHEDKTLYPVVKDLLKARAEAMAANDAEAQAIAEKELSTYKVTFKDAPDGLTYWER